MIDVNELCLFERFSGLGRSGGRHGEPPSSVSMASYIFESPSGELVGRLEDLNIDGFGRFSLFDDCASWWAEAPGVFDGVMIDCEPPLSSLSWRISALDIGKEG
jgi:hypothetical protein